MCLVVHSRFERALQTVDPSVTLPYFDSNLDHHLGDDLATQTVTWTADFAGNGNGRVRTGPFADWSLPFPVNNRRFLYRNLTFAPEARTAPALMSDQALNTILNARQLRDICWNVDPSFETFHGATHNWVGGVMVNLPASPSDPMFFLHHSFIDCLFTWMRDNQRSRGFDVDFDYPNDTIAIGVGLRRQGDGRRIQRPEDSWHYSLAEMRPFGPLRNIDGLSSFYEDAIQCESRPTCSRADISCGGSDYIFCDEFSYRCAPKLRLGAACERFSRSRPCSRGECCNGVCQESCQSREQQDRQSVRPKEVPNRDQVPDKDDEARPNDRVEDDKEPPMVETMHGVKAEDDEMQHPVTFKPSEPVRRVEGTDVDDDLEEMVPDLSAQETIERSQADDTLPLDPASDDILSGTPRPSDDSSIRQRNSNEAFIIRPHPGVPTHAPYVMPTIPPVPTHPPYIVPRVPTHPPGYNTFPPVPTHPPSVFERRRHLVKRDGGS